MVGSDEISLGLWVHEVKVLSSGLGLSISPSSCSVEVQGVFPLILVFSVLLVVL
ncbi:unnamed protein product [Brassica oleracea]